MCFLVCSTGSWFCPREKFGINLALASVSGVPTVCQSNKYAMTRNWSNQNPNPALKTKREITKINNRQNTKRTGQERRTTERDVGGLTPTSAVLCP